MQRVLKGVLRGAVWSFAVIGVAAVAVLGVRWLHLVPRYEPIGQCIKDSVAVDAPKRFEQLDPGATVVGLAASGGGSRAAYLAAAILREMRASSARIDTGATTEARSLLDQIDAVSAVSGGALTAAYFVAYGEQLRSADADSPTWRGFLDKMARATGGGSGIGSRSPIRASGQNISSATIIAGCWRATTTMRRSSAAPR